jgi:hypothetical protein
MNAASLLSDLQAQGVHLEVDAGALKYRAPKKAITAELLANLKTHKADLMAILSSQKDAIRPIDWNNHPDAPPTDPFTSEAIQNIKAGKAVPVWSSVLEEWLWFVRDEKAKVRLVAEGCQVPIYTLGELAVVVNSKLGPDGLTDVHAIKKKFGGDIQWSPRETP